MLLSSCIKEENEVPYSYLSTRTVLFYLAGDNDLRELGRISELLRAAWNYTGNRCLIYYDADDAPPVLLSLRGGCATYPTPFIETVTEYPEENSASAETFGRVVRDVVQMYPADDYGLVFASHGSGWLPEGTLHNPNRSARSIGKDTDPATLASGRTEMELADFAAAIPDRQFAFIVFEACLMSGVEVAYELRNKTDYLVASSAELLSPGFVPIYEQAASQLLFDASLPVEQALTAFASHYFDYMNAQYGAYRSATMSVIRTSGMEPLATLAAEIYAGADLGPAALTGLQHFDRPGSYGDDPARPRYFDFGQYMTRIAASDATRRLDEALRGAVAWKAATPEFLPGYNGFRIDCHSGLTTYIEQAEFPALNAAYRRTAWYRATRTTNTDL